MGSVDLIASSLDSIRQISSKLEGAVVYLDSGCSEAFQMIGAFSLFLELGVRTVCSLENASPLDAAVSWTAVSENPAAKMVVITSRLLSDAHRYILRCLSTHQNVQSCSIFTSISEVAHSAYVNSPLGPDAFHEYEVLLLQDYQEQASNSDMKGVGSPKQDISGRAMMELGVDGGSPRKQMVDSEGNSVGKDSDDSGSIVHADASNLSPLVVSVEHFPMVLCPLSPRVFVFPSESTIGEACLSTKHEDSLSPGLPAICTGKAFSADDAPAGAILIAHFLYHLASKLDMKMEIFSLGDLSKSIGKILTDMSGLYDLGRRSKRSAGLLLIDRSLDLLTPCCHGDSLVDRIISSLPRRERVAPISTKSLQFAVKHSHPNVERTPLEIRIPLEFLDKVDSTASSTSLSEHIGAFSSGWNTNDLNMPNKNSSVQGESDFQSGSLVTSESYRGVNYLEALFDRKTKDGASLIKKWLMEIVRHDKVPFSRSQFGSPTVNMKSLIKVLCSQEKFMIRNKGIIQLAVAAEIALGEPHCSHWDALASAERMLAVGAGDMSQSLSIQIRDLINTSNLTALDNSHGNKQAKGLLLFRDALLLAVIGYILAGENFPSSGYNSPFSWEEEHSLKEAVVDAILEMQSVPKFHFLNGLEVELENNSRKLQSAPAEESKRVSLAYDDFDYHSNSRKLQIVPAEETKTTSSADDDLDDQWGAWGDEDSDHNDEPVYGNMQLKLELRDRVDNLFKTFHKLSGMKWRNHIGREGETASQGNFCSEDYRTKGFLSRILTKVLAKYEIPGLEYHSSAVGRFLISGLGRFGLGQSKPRLGDQDTILIFVVGGINCLEVFEAREAIAESGRPELQLILGGTTLLTPEDMFDMLLGSSSYI